MFLFNSRSRLVLCLVMQVVSVILLAIPLKLIPDQRLATMHGRAQLCETIAISGSALVQGGVDSTGYLKRTLSEIDRRNDSILSLAVCQRNGRCLVATGDHQHNWVNDRDYPIDRQVVVPLYTSKNDHWGDVQVRFKPLSPMGGRLNAIVMHPWTRLLTFVGGLSYILFHLFLWRAMGHQSPSKAVPKRVRSTLETLAGGLIVLDDKQTIALANQTFAEAVGCTSDELRGSPISQFHWAFADANDSSYPWEDVVSNGQRVSSRPVRLRGSDGEVRTFMVNSSPVQQNEEVRGVLISLDDITDLETAKAELQVSKQAAEDANRAKSDFLARMSHEIRTPMNAVLGFADVLRRGITTDADEQRQYLNIIHSSGEHLLVLINDILDLSKIESGKLQVEHIAYSPAQIVNQVIATLQGRAAEKNITLEAEYMGNIPEIIYTDPVRLRQVFTNLVGNAIKFTTKGGVRLQVSVDPSSSTMIGKIIDTGVGIPADKLKTIFDPFSQADGSVTRKFGGTGLGLAISRKLARALGGDVVAHSIMGEGSVFNVTIQTGDISGVRLVTPDQAQKDCVQEQKALQNIRSGLRILVADDGESNRRLLKIVLGRCGANVIEAENGKVAVKHAIDNPFDFILMDMQMPVMDGYDATKTLRQNGYKAPIVALTADAMKGTEAKCLAAGCTAYLTKPIVMDDLVATLNKLDPRSDERSSEEEKLLQNSVVNARADVASKTHASDTSTPAKPLFTDEAATAAPLPAKKRTASAASGPLLVSALPTEEDEEFAEIVEMFIERLQEKIQTMTKSWRGDDLAAVAVEAHWLKGSGGMAGFDAFSDPAKRLETSAKAGRSDEVETILREIVQLAKRIQPPRALATV